MLQTEFYKATDPASRHLMVVLHGLGDSSAGYRWLPGALQLPSMNYLLVNAPDAYYGGFSWYDLAGEPGPGVRRSRDQLFELLDQLRAAGFPTEGTVLFGFSQGCLMTIEVGMRCTIGRPIARCIDSDTRPLNVNGPRAKLARRIVGDAVRTARLARLET